jgi:hypothetical protein
LIGGIIIFGQIAAHLSLLKVACNRYDRRGQLRIDRLLADHGPCPYLGSREP